MKKTIALLVGALSCAAVFAVADSDVRIMFSTPGPDKYADKTDVKVGERYVLVWKNSATNEVVFSADGQIAGGKKVLVWDTKEDGRCSQVLFTVNSKWLADNGFVGGTWSVYMLDTRVFAEDGTYAFSGKNDKGIPSVINASNVAVANVDAVASVKADAISGGTASALPESVGQPTITDIDFDGDMVEVTVANTSPSINYVLADGDKPDALSTHEGAKAQVGNGTITLVTPKTSGGKQFFKVNRK